ncbi:unnamed protein product [Wuchereria bancrofti]|nr:unnamed protein product [Wuchereria bancrofti]
MLFEDSHWEYTQTEFFGKSPHGYARDSYITTSTTCQEPVDLINRGLVSTHRYFRENVISKKETGDESGSTLITRKKDGKTLTKVRINRTQHWYITESSVTIIPLESLPPFINY